MLERIARRFQLSPDDLRHALTLGGVLFAITSSYTLVKTARDALFLDRQPAAVLPYVYLGTAVVTLVASLVFGRLTRRAATWQTLAGTALVAAIALLGFAWAFPLERPWVPVVFYLWVNLYGLILTSQFWAFTNSISDPREAKRIFGIIGGGGILGGLVGGIAAARLGGTGTLTVLLVLGAALVALAVPIVWASVRRGGVAQSDVTPATPAPNPLRLRYVRWLATAALCSVLVTGLLDFQVKTLVQSGDLHSALSRWFGLQAGVVPDRHALARFFGVFYTVQNLAALGIQLFATRWMLQRLGAGWSAAVLPAGLSAGALASLTAPGFSTVIGTRLWDQVMRLSIHKSAAELFYFPLEPGLRRRAKALIEAGLERAGDGLAGALILIVRASQFSVNTLTVALLVSALTTVWLAAWWVVRRGYVEELGRNLRRMNLDPAGERVSLREASLGQAMVGLLDSRWERVVLHGIEMLEDNAPDRLAQRLPALLEHPSPAVRTRALAVAAERWPERARERLPALLEDPDPFVRVAALRVQVGLEGTAPLEALGPYLEAGDPRLRAAALACIVELTDDPGLGALEGLLRRFGSSPDPADRVAVAEALGARPSPSPVHALLVPLIEDDDPDVRGAAVRSAGRAGVRTAVPRLIETLGEPATVGAAREGLAAFGDRVVGTLGDYLGDPGVRIEVRREIAGVLGDLASQEAVNALFRVRERTDVLLMTRVLKASNRIRATNADAVFPTALVSEDIEHDVRSHLFALVNYRSCPIGSSDSGERLLCIALNERMDQALDRMFRRLALIYPMGEILAARRGVGASDTKTRGHALEYLENALTPEHRELVLPLLDDTGDDRRMALAESRYRLRYRGQDASLAAMLQTDDAWLRTLATYVVGVRRMRPLQSRVQAELEDADWRVRETAAWTMAVLAAT